MVRSPCLLRVLKEQGVAPGARDQGSRRVDGEHFARVYYRREEASGGCARLLSWRVEPYTVPWALDSSVAAQALNAHYPHA
jgi:hypothetical protein